MMKNLLFTLAIVAGATTCNAQSITKSTDFNAPKLTHKTSKTSSLQKAELSKTLNTVKLMQNAQVYNKPMMQFSVANSATMAKAPRKTYATGVYYKRPEGTMYSAYVFGSNSEYAALTVPPLTTLTYTNGCTNAAAATWTLNTYDLSSYTDSDNNLVWDWSPCTSEDGYSPMYAPTITCGGEDFELTYLTLTVNDFMPIMSENTSVTGMYYGFQEGPAFGTEAVCDAQVTSQVAGATVLGYLKNFEKPASPMYVSSFDILAWSKQETPIPEGMQLTAVIYECDSTGAIVAPRDTLTCTSMDDLNAFSAVSGYYGYANFSKTVTNEFGDVESAPITIDYPFCVFITGYNQAGVDTRFFMIDNGEDDLEWEAGSPCYLVTEAEDGNTYYYRWKNKTFTSGSNYCYTLPIQWNTLYDKIDVLDTAYSYTEDGEISSVINNVNVLRVSADGQTVTTEGYTAETGVGAALVYTAFPIIETDDEGNVTDQNYDFNGADDADWLKWSVNEDSWENYSVNYVIPVCTALPDGVTGRSAVIELAGKGVKANTKIYVLQGDAKMPTESVTGDVNADGSVDIADVNAIISVICGSETNSAADVNGDGAVDIADVNAVIGVICGAE